MSVQRAGWRVPRSTARRRGKAVCGGRSALIVVCAGDVVIFLTGLLLLRLQRPFGRAVQVSVNRRVLCEACVFAPCPGCWLGGASTGYAVKMKVPFPLSFLHPHLVCIVHRVAQYLQAFLEYPLILAYA